MNKTHESVAAVVVTFNSADLIADLVASLQPGMAGWIHAVDATSFGLNGSDSSLPSASAGF